MAHPDFLNCAPKLDILFETNLAIESAVPALVQDLKTVCEIFPELHWLVNYDGEFQPHLVSLATARYEVYLPRS